MKFILAFSISLILCQFSHGFTSKSLRVRIDDGKIIGKFLRSTNGRPIRGFLGIPFAAPPVGDLRFKAPKPVERWFHNILYAHKEPPMCSQVTFYSPEKKIEGQEDCLYLNVYTPEVKDLKAEKLPVLVWFHGGGWFFGHGGYSSFGPEYFLDHDVVLVSGNYRLGPLGFLSTEDQNASGNFGLKDQMAILEWVQQNIEKFGGDPRSVTIFGESAGGASVNYHMISPLSRGLFHRAISQSGTLMNVWSDPARKGVAKMRAIRLADMMGCPISGTSMKQMIECLKNVSAEKITLAQFEFYEIGSDPLVLFSPVIEDINLEDEEPFLVDLRYRKHSHDIPWLTGITSEEGIFRSIPFLSTDKMKQTLAKSWEKLLPIAFYYDHLSEDEIAEINVDIYNMYFKADFLTTTEKNLTHMFTDGYFIGMLENLEYRLRDNNRDNTFVYLFSHKGYVSFGEVDVFSTLNSDVFHGTAHADDLLYLFPPPRDITKFYSSFPSNEDEVLRKSMVKLWVDFARTGTPTPEWSKKSPYPFWTPASKFPLDYMLIGNENGESKELFQMKKDLYSKRADFWMKLKEKYGLKTWKTGVAEQVSKDEL